MDVSCLNEIPIVCSDPVTVVNDVPIYSKTASRRTIAKYLRKKVNISKALATDSGTFEKSRNLIKDINGNSIFSQISFVKSEPSATYNTDKFNQDLKPLTFPSNMHSFVNNYNLTPASYDDDNQENNSSITDMLRCVLEGNKGYVDSIEKCNEYQPSWLPNHLPFNYCDQQITCSSLSASIDKQEREIAYNLLVRRIIDDSLDRNMIFSHQPKEILNMINAILVRQFPEYEESKHRGKVKSYLKACRRNSKKNNGRILMKNTAAYLTSGPGNRLMHQIYNSEKDALDIIKKESERLKLTQMVKPEPIQCDVLTSSADQVTATQQKHIFSITNNLPTILPASLSTIHTSFKPIAQIYTAQSKINVTQLPLLMPFNSTIHTESVKKTNTNSQSPPSEDIIKSICEIAKAFVEKDSGVNMTEIILQLRATANVLDKIAKTLEQSTINSIPN